MVSLKSYAETGGRTCAVATVCLPWLNGKSTYNRDGNGTQQKHVAGQLHALRAPKLHLTLYMYDPGNNYFQTAPPN